MHRPTRQHKHLVSKLDAKKTRSKRSGKKARRWKLDVAKFAELTK